jgi:hypothetical protein
VKLAVLAAADDVIAAHVADLARARGAEVVRLDYHGLQPLAWDGDAWLIGGVELTRMRGVFVRALPPRAQSSAPPIRPSPPSSGGAPAWRSSLAPMWPRAACAICARAACAWSARRRRMTPSPPSSRCSSVRACPSPAP